LASDACGFPKSRRLLSKKDYRLVFAESVRASDVYLTVLARSNKRPVARLGLAISRKALRRAVDRNRVKRVIREHFRLRHVMLAGLDIVVMARSACATADRSALRSSLNQHWNALLQRCASFSSASSKSTASS
jgi:ribonuclease P protein component